MPQPKEIPFPFSVGDVIDARRRQAEQERAAALAQVGEQLQLSPETTQALVSRQAQIPQQLSPALPPFPQDAYKTGLSQYTVFDPTTGRTSSLAPTSEEGFSFDPALSPQQRKAAGEAAYSAAQRLWPDNPNAWTAAKFRVMVPPAHQARTEITQAANPYYGYGSNAPAPGMFDAYGPVDLALAGAAAPVADITAGTVARIAEGAARSPNPKLQLTPAGRRALSSVGETLYPARYRAPGESVTDLMRNVSPEAQAGLAATPPRTPGEAYLRGGAEIGGEIASFLVPSLPAKGASILSRTVGTAAKIAGAPARAVLGRGVLSTLGVGFPEKILTMGAAFGGFSGTDEFSRYLAGDAEFQDVLKKTYSAGPDFIKHTIAAVRDVSARVEAMKAQGGGTPEQQYEVFQALKPLAAAALLLKHGTWDAAKGWRARRTAKSQAAGSEADFLKQIQRPDLEGPPARRGEAPPDVPPEAGPSEPVPGPGGPAPGRRGPILTPAPGVTPASPAAPTPPASEAPAQQWIPGQGPVLTPAPGVTRQRSPSEAAPANAQDASAAQLNAELRESVKLTAADARDRIQRTIESAVDSVDPAFGAPALAPAPVPVPAQAAPSAGGFVPAGPTASPFLNRMRDRATSARVEQSAPPRSAAEEPPPDRGFDSGTGSSSDVVAARLAENQQIRVQQAAKAQADAAQAAQNAAIAQEYAKRAPALEAQSNALRNEIGFARAMGAAPVEILKDVSVGLSRLRGERRATGGSAPTVPYAKLDALKRQAGQGMAPAIRRGFTSPEEAMRFLRDQQLPSRAYQVVRTPDSPQRVSGGRPSAPAPEYHLVQRQNLTRAGIQLPQRRPAGVVRDSASNPPAREVPPAPERETPNRLKVLRDRVAASREAPPAPEQAREPEVDRVEQARDAAGIPPTTTREPPPPPEISEESPAPSVQTPPAPVYGGMNTPAREALPSAEEVSRWADPANPDRPEISVNGVPMHVERLDPGGSGYLILRETNGRRAMLSGPDGDAVAQAIRAGKKYIRVSARNINTPPPAGSPRPTEAPAEPQSAEPPAREAAGAQPATETPPAATDKLPWEMTRAEYDQYLFDEAGYQAAPRNLGEQEARTRMHRDSIRSALAEGKPVRPEVLSEYPDLAPAQEEPNAVQEQSAGSVLQREPSKTGIAGGERERVEQVQPREEAPPAREAEQAPPAREVTSGAGKSPVYGAVGTIQDYLRAGGEVQVRTSQVVIPVTKPEHIRVIGGRWVQVVRGRGKWVNLTPPQVDSLLAQAKRGQSQAASAAPQRPAPAPSAGEITRPPASTRPREFPAQAEYEAAQAEAKMLERRRKELWKPVFAAEERVGNSAETKAAIAAALKGVRKKNERYAVEAEAKREALKRDPAYIKAREAHTKVVIAERALEDRLAEFEKQREAYQKESFDAESAELSEFYRKFPWHELEAENTRLYRAAQDAEAEVKKSAKRGDSEEDYDAVQDTAYTLSLKQKAAAEVLQEKLEASRAEYYKREGQQPPLPGGGGDNFARIRDEREAARRDLERGPESPPEPRGSAFTPAETKERLAGLPTAERIAAEAPYTVAVDPTVRLRGKPTGVSRLKEVIRTVSELGKSPALTWTEDAETKEPRLAFSVAGGGASESYSLKPEGYGIKVVDKPNPGETVYLDPAELKRVRTNQFLLLRRRAGAEPPAPEREVEQAPPAREAVSDAETERSIKRSVEGRLRESTPDTPEGERRKTAEDAAREIREGREEEATKLVEAAEGKKSVPEGDTPLKPRDPKGAEAYMTPAERAAKDRALKSLAARFTGGAHGYASVSAMLLDRGMWRDLNALAGAYGKAGIRFAGKQAYAAKEEFKRYLKGQLSGIQVKIRNTVVSLWDALAGWQRGVVLNELWTNTMGANPSKREAYPQEPTVRENVALSAALKKAEAAARGGYASSEAYTRLARLLRGIRPYSTRGRTQTLHPEFRDMLPRGLVQILADPEASEARKTLAIMDALPLVLGTQSSDADRAALSDIAAGGKSLEGLPPVQLRTYGNRVREFLDAAGTFRKTSAALERQRNTALSEKAAKEIQAGPKGQLTPRSTSLPAERNVVAAYGSDMTRDLNGLAVSLTGKSASETSLGRVLRTDLVAADEACLRLLNPVLSGMESVLSRHGMEGAALSRWINDDVLIDVPGASGGFTCTRNALASIAFVARSPDGRKVLADNGFALPAYRFDPARNVKLTEEQSRALEAQLTPFERDLVDYMSRAYDALWPHMNAAFKRIHGRDMGYRDLYAHLVRNFDQPLPHEKGTPAPDDLQSYFSDASLAETSATRERTGSQRPLAIRGALADFYNYVNSATNFATMYEPARRAMAVLRGPAGTEIVKRLGESGIRQVREMIRNVAGVSTTKEPVLASRLGRLTNRIASNMVPALLAGRPGPIFGNMAGAMLVHLGMPAAARKYVPAAMVQTLANPVIPSATRARMMTHEYWHNRFVEVPGRGRMDPAQPGLLEGPKHASMAPLVKLRDSLIGGLRWSDNKVSEYAFNLAESYLRGEGHLEGLTTEQQLRLINDVSSRAVRDTQNPTRPVDMAYLTLAARKMPGGPLLYMLTSSPLKIRNVLAASWSRGFSSGAEATTLAALGWLLVSGYSAAQSGLLYGVQKKDEAWKPLAQRAAIRFLTEIGDTVAPGLSSYVARPAIEAILTGESQDNPDSVARVLSAIHNGFDAYRSDKSSDADRAKARKRIGRAAFDFLNSTAPFVGIPDFPGWVGRGVYQQLKGFSPESGKRSLFQRKQ